MPLNVNITVSMTASIESIITKMLKRFPEATGDYKIFLPLDGEVSST
jgi:hypothetical protein